MPDLREEIDMMTEPTKAFMHWCERRIRLHQIYDV